MINVAEKVRELETIYTSGNGVQSSKYVNTDLYEDINTIYAYLASKHISGEQDSLGRDKPFFNIVLSNRNIWFRATDIDRRNISVKSTKNSNVIGALLLNVHLQNWMKKENFGTFLNDWGLVLAGFNSAVVKTLEKDGRLIITTVPWSRIICDQVNFEVNPKIEVLELTEAELYARYDKENVARLVDAKRTRETLDKRRKDDKPDYYKIYEVHGMFPKYCLTGNDKDTEPVQQIHILSFLAKNSGRRKEYEDFTLYKGEEKEDPYMLTYLLPSDDGSVSLDGAVKNLFQSQWMVNHTKKAIKDQLDLASKLFFQTADANFLGQNAISSIENGDIMIHTPNNPLSQVNNGSHDVVSLMNFGQDWKNNGQEVNGISEAMLGQTPKSGTAWRQTEAILNESYSLFEIMTENKGLVLERIIKYKILTFLKRKMNNSEEISATLDMQGIKQIENIYLTNAPKKIRNQMIKETILNGNIAEDVSEEDIRAELKQGLEQQGNQRFMKPSEIPTITWKEIFKDLIDDVDIEITGENSNTREMFATLNTALQMVMNPNYATNPQAQMIVGKILARTNHLSPLELSTFEATSTQTSTVPAIGSEAGRTESLSSNINM